MLPVVDGEFTDLQQDAVRWPTRLKQCAAVCNSLNLVRKGALIGDTADYAAFKTCEATFQVQPAVFWPKILSLHQHGASKMQVLAWNGSFRQWNFLLAYVFHAMSTVHC